VGNRYNPVRKEFVKKKMWRASMKGVYPYMTKPVVGNDDRVYYVCKMNGKDYELKENISDTLHHWFETEAEAITYLAEMMEDAWK